MHSKSASLKARPVLGATVVTCALFAAGVAGSAGAWAADDLIVSGNRASAAPSLDQKATNACFEAFLAELLPGNTARVRTIIPADGVNIFTDDGDSLVSPYKTMVVEMTANAIQGNELLARSVCRVNRHAKVLRLAMHVTAAGKVAGLSLESIKLAMTNR
jgi:hypothetical protein